MINNMLRNTKAYLRKAGIELMAPVCDFVDSLVPDLTLRGVGLAYQKHLSEMGV